MSRLPMVPQAPDDAAIKELFDEVRAARKPDYQISNLYRTLGLSAPMFRAWLNFAWPLRLDARSPRKLRELMILRGAQISRTAYEWAHHVPLALDAGVTQAQIEALCAWTTSDAFDGREKAVLQLAEDITRGPAASAATIELLQQQSFDHAQIVELVLTASFYVCVSRVLKSMDIELEPGFEAHLANFASAGAAGAEDS